VEGGGGRGAEAAAAAAAEIILNFINGHFLGRGWMKRQRWRYRLSRREMKYFHRIRRDNPSSTRARVHRSRLALMQEFIRTLLVKYSGTH
jgi:hypothetical protein